MNKDKLVNAVLCCSITLLPFSLSFGEGRGEAGRGEAVLGRDSAVFVRYTGAELSNPAYHDGQLAPAVGVHNIQVMRANREYPDVSNGNGWTYNHQPMLAYWNGRFYLQYLSDPADEHVPPSQTLLMSSEDGYAWTHPDVVFPPYNVPDGYTKPGRTDVAKDLIAVMHQRVGFYVSKSGRLLTMGYYGVAFDKKDDPNDGNGIGRVVREIRKDGTYGPIHFIAYNHGFSEKNTDHPYYIRSKDKDFVRSCREILDNPLYMMQWVEEADRNDPLIPLHKEYKAFNSYTLPDGRIVSLWKHALTSLSEDGGKTWAEPVLRAKGFVNSNAKIWGQRLSDGMYATVYNPSEFRWPLAISLSRDGLEYTTLNLVNGEIPPMRYGGNYKSFGPQYVRGILEGNGAPPDGDLRVTYSVNKEDIWVARIPTPVRLKAGEHANDNLSACRKLSDLTAWNIYSPLWAPVSLESVDGQRWLTLRDKDPFDYAKAERVIPATKELTVSFDLVAGQNDRGTLQIEFTDDNGIACSRLELTPDGVFRAKGGARFGNLMRYEPGKVYHVEAVLSVANRNINVSVDGKRAGTRMFYAPVPDIRRIVFRTGELRLFPTPETPADQDFDIPGAGEQAPPTVYRIANLKTASADPGAGAAILSYADFSRYADYFNGMEDENIAQAIPNAAASAWMERNIPLFECPQKNIEEMYYFRWWTLRKHIRETPVGYGMTEFLVDRSYADKYNLIACALGHHIYESRWLRNRDRTDQIIRTWYRGNEGKPMAKMMNFSSWNIDAVWNRYLANGDKAFLLDLKPDLEEEYKRWERTHRLPNGLYWQADVQDGMEESISGGRRKQYARPTINSYMYGNARALHAIGLLSGDEAMAMTYGMKADTLKRYVQERLWNASHSFFETVRGDTLAGVREAIGYIPWYFNLPDAHTFDAAWKQITDTGGFAAPYGLTTAERRHPDFRTHGAGKCEWDGAVWPFATAQTLTAMANFINRYPQDVLTDSVFFRQMELYVESQHHRGRPYIGEYLDEMTGYWLKGDQERSRYYNHSTFNDLVITGLAGLRPRADDTIEVNPLIPEGVWDWFCLDNVPYHGHRLTILWDADGSRYHRGKGLRVLTDGKEVGHSDRLERILIDNGQMTIDNYNAQPTVNSKIDNGQMTIDNYNAQPTVNSKAQPTVNYQLSTVNYQLSTVNWIGSDTLAARSICLRKTFAVDREVAKATAYVCGLGHYELSLNGRKVGDDLFAPLWSDYNRTVYYNTYDVTAHLRRGGNAAGVLLGNGFYNVQGGRYTKLKGSFGPPTLLFRLQIDYTDGSRETVCSGPGWTYAPSPVTFNCIYGGESYDARLEQQGWDSPGFDDSAWQPAVVQAPPRGTLRPQQAPPVRIMERYAAQTVTPLSPSAFTLDMGQNLAGFPEITVRGKRGQKVTLRVGETLTAEGAADQRQTGRPHYYEYTLRGEGDETWHPRFSYYGFRYIQVEGAAPKDSVNPQGLPVLTDIASCFVHSSARRVSAFETSNTLFNATHRLIGMAVRSNMQAVFTDCPHREKLGWLEQVHLNGPGLLYNYDLRSYIPKIMQDMADAQRPDGAMPSIAPQYIVFEGPGMDAFAESPEWGSALVILPFMYRKAYGDDSLIRTWYPRMRAYTDYLTTRADGHILSFGLGDWYDYGDFKAGFSRNTPVPLVATAHYYMDLIYLAEAARLTGETADAERYTGLARQVKQAFNDRFLDRRTAQYGTGSQCSNALPLFLDLTENDEQYARTLDNLIKDIRARGDRLTTGDVGTRYLIRALARNGRHELIYRMFNHDEAPGYGFQLKHGATTLTEQWDPRRGSSRNHFMMGQIDEWFFADLAGIQIDAAAAGHEAIVIRPQVVGDLNRVRASTETPYGEVRTEWKREGTRITLEVVIPPNASATIYPPGDGGIHRVGGGVHRFESTTLSNVVCRSTPLRGDDCIQA